ncbi:MAG: hypothetical protein CVU48_02645 [Candidatus Cloacimonetes bacterium HGW-Cloacimonetes-1]|nr:MAG: hypothetical protein CVU48_02645 [Candidatus Cloacimonetes bacterium HGW-Cloacimonetes-1]
MKKILLLSLSIFLALVATELTVRYVIGYPSYTPGNRQYISSDHLKDYRTITWKAPYSKFWSVEGGNQVFRYNNIGLPGSDIDTNFDKSIFLLGDSFIEALQVPNTNTASAVFQDNLIANNRSFNVLNLGSSAHDPFVLWHRSMFFAQHFRPSTVILVSESYSTMMLYLKRHTLPLRFYTHDSFGSIIPPNMRKIYIDRVRSLSAFLTLCTVFKDKRDDTLKQVDDSIAKIPSNPDSISLLFECLEQFDETYGDKFVFVSLMNDNPHEKELAEFCTNQGIKYFQNNQIMKPYNQIHGEGHLNEIGNRQLGVYLSKTYMTLYQTDNKLRSLGE